LFVSAVPDDVVYFYNYTTPTRKAVWQQQTKCKKTDLVAKTAKRLLNILGKHTTLQPIKETQVVSKRPTN